MEVQQQLFVEILTKYQVQDQQIEQFTKENETDEQVIQCFRSLQVSQDLDLQLSDADLTEEELDTILKYGADTLDELGNSLKFGNGEQGVYLSLAFMVCKIHEKFKKTDVELESALLYYQQKNPQNYVWYINRINNATQKILS